MLISKIISGGNTGADQAGLVAAKHLGLQTGGYAPKGWRTEAGPAPWLADYGLIESNVMGYKDRTCANVRLAHGTLIYGKRSAGSLMTQAACVAYSKPYLWLHNSSEESERQLKQWLHGSRILILNVAGNRESVTPGIYQDLLKFLVRALGVAQ